MNQFIKQSIQRLSPQLQQCQNQIDQVDPCKARDMLKMQLEELEILSSMFPNPNELVVTDQSVVADINQFVEEASTTIPPYLDYTINLVVDDINFELCVNLNSYYPEKEPDVFVRSNHLNRHQQTLLNTDLSSYYTSLERGELCVGSIVIWLQDNASKYCSKADTCPTKQPKQKNKESFSRLWIYSHHIYNKTKRKEILEHASDLNISGFCMPGKPGIICIEGQSDDCNEWWQTIRNMTWQKIMCKKTEEEIVKKGENLDSHRKFGKFQEITFSKENKDQNRHMDMGEFYKFLKEHDCAEVFKDYFGIDGKLGESQ